MSEKCLVRIEYRCGIVSPSDSSRMYVPDEWVLCEGSPPTVGDTGCGKRCYEFDSLYACDDVDCIPLGGRVALVEPYSDARARELGLL